MKNMRNQLSVILIEDDEASCLAMEAYFRELDGIDIIRTTNSSSQALEYVRNLNPDAVILDLELHNGAGSGIAFLSGLNALCSAAAGNTGTERRLTKRPYVLITTNNSSQTTYHAVRRLGADFILYKHQEDYSPKNVAEILLGVCTTEAFTSHSETAQHTTAISDMDLRKKICAELDNINISPRLRGYTYLADAIEIYTRERVPNVSSVIGKKHRKTGDSVERAMQNAINKAWGKADIDTLRKNYTAYVSPETGVPTIMDFVCYYANKIKNDIQ